MGSHNETMTLLNMLMCGEYRNAGHVQKPSKVHVETYKWLQLFV